MSERGPAILVRSLSEFLRTDRHGNEFNYLSRSDHHSKVACWAIIFDLMRESPLLREHARTGRVGFGINVDIKDFQHDRSKKLDLVICQPASGAVPGSRTLMSMARHWEISLTPEEQNELIDLPELQQSEAGSVLLALEAKACMTSHQKALPRLYDELNSSHLTVHGAHDLAIAAGFVMINIAETFLSPDLTRKIATQILSGARIRNPNLRA